MFSSKISARLFRTEKHLKLKGVLTFPMGCRSLLNSYQDDNGNYITWGRANMGMM